jgi:hypothetical protein
MLRDLHWRAIIGDNQQLVIDIISRHLDAVADSDPNDIITKHSLTARYAVYRELRGQNARSTKTAH